jgi:hypothetical protein
MINRATLATSLLAVAALAACSDGTSTAGDGQVAFQVAARTTSADVNATGETVSLGSDAIVFDKVQLVVRKIRLEGARSATCENDSDAAETGGETHRSDSADAHADTAHHSVECAEAGAGPILVDLPLGGGAARSFDATLPAGTYRELHFQVHVPTGTPADQAFLAANPDFAGVSIKASGTFNGTHFDFTSDVEASQNVELGTPFTVAAQGTTSLTLNVDLSGWFKNAGGTGLVDPASALKGQPNESLVANNINASFHAFRDNNHDGADDD